MPGVGLLSSDWLVPTKPTSRGPAPPLIASSIYLFNGVEDGGGEHGNASVILQPVLQFGKSGCLHIGKLTDWYLTSYAVSGAGRAFCGPSLGPLKPGEAVRGTMTLLPPRGSTGAADGANMWRVDSTRLGTGEMSTASIDMGEVVLDAAYLTLEAMIIYSCSAYPASGSVAFTNNSVLDRAMKPLPSDAPWVKRLRHTECGQDVQLSGTSVSDPVVISWSTAPNVTMQRPTTPV